MAEIQASCNLAATFFIQAKTLITSTLIIFCFLFAAYYLARKIDGGSPSLWLIVILSIVLFSVELLSALTLLGRSSLLIMGVGYMGIIAFLEWKANQRKQKESQKTSRHLLLDIFVAIDADAIQGALPFAALFLVVAVFFAFCPIAEIDSVSYHLPISSQLVHTGSAWNVFYAAYVGPNTYFPANHEALQAFFMSVFGNIRLNFIVTILGLLLFYHALRDMTERRVSGLLTSLALLSVVSIPFLSKQLMNVQVDLFLFCLIGSTTAFLLSSIIHKNRIDAVKCFLTLGLAIGAKYSALEYAVVILPFVAWLAYRLRIRPREWWKFPALALLTGGFWYLRNWIVADNPLYPFGIRLLHWEGHKKILVDVIHTSLWDAANMRGLRATISAVLANDNFPSLIGKISLTMLPFTLILLLCILIVYLYLITKKASRASQDFRRQVLLFLIFAGLLYLLIATAIIYATSPYTFIIWNEAVRYSAIFVAIIPVVFVMAMYVSPRLAGSTIALYAAAIGGYNLIFRSFVFDPHFTGLLREKATAFSEKTTLFMLLLIVLMMIATLISAKKMRLAAHAACMVFVAVCLSLLPSTFPPRSSADDALLSVELPGYTRLLPAIRLLRQEPASGKRRIALSGLTPYWIFENEGLVSSYVNIDGCDECKYPYYRQETNSVRAHPNEAQWKELMKKRGIDYLIVADDLRNVANVPYEKTWAEKDTAMFQSLLVEQGVALYRVQSAR